MKKDNFLDRIISTVSPEWGLQRMRARTALQHLRKYEAASHSRRTEGWHSTSASQNNETNGAISTLRNRSRDLVRNNAWAKKAVDVIANNVVGSGIRPMIMADSNGKAKKLASAWKQWAETTDCDVTGRLNFYGLQRLIMKTVAESGECIVVRRRRNSPGKIPFQLQVLEGDFIPHTYNYYPISSGEGKFTLMGIEFNESDQRTGYWMYKKHPGDIYNFSTPEWVSADEVLHIYQVERPGQIRGIPLGVSAMLRLKDFDEYEDAQLVRQKIAACYSVFITDPLGEAGGTKNPAEERVEPGIIYELDPGKQVTFASPPGAEGYDSYTKNVLRAVAAGYGVTYEALTGDLSNVNFSSGRMGWLEFQRNVSSWQDQVVIPVLCDGVFRWFVEGAQLSMGINAEAVASWTPPRREMIDPAKEIKAMTDAIRAGLLPWQETIRQLGQDPEQVLAQLQADNEAFDKAKLMLVSDPRHDPTRRPEETADGAANPAND